MTTNTARELLQEALTYSNAWLTALEADGEDEAAASQAEFNERITSFLAQPEPEVERLVRERDEAMDIVSTMRLIEHEIDDYKLRAEAAEKLHKELLFLVGQKLPDDLL